eukprot:UN1909
MVNHSWLLVFALCLFELFLSFVNLYCWKGLHFSWSNSLFFIFIIVGLIFAFHFWFRDLLRELDKKYEVLLICLFLLFFLFLASEALLFISFFWGSFHSLSSPTLGVCFGEGFYPPDVLCLYFLQTHFGVSSLSHPDNAKEACALLTPLHIVPEWYFLCQYAMLKLCLTKMQDS